VELKEYFKILQKNLWLIIVTTILVALVAYVFTLRQPITYEANANLTIIPKPNTELKNVYEYDGYYALQAASIFSLTMASWMQNPDTVAEIYQNSGYKIDKGQTSKSLSKLIKPTASPNTFSLGLQLKNKDKTKVQKLTKAAIEVAQNKTAEFNKTAGSKINFEVTASEPTILEVAPKKTLNTGIGAVAGLVLGIFLAFALEYFRK